MFNILKTDSKLINVISCTLSVLGFQFKFFKIEVESLSLYEPK